MGIWADKKKDISSIRAHLGRPLLVVSKDKLKALAWEDRCRIAYDPETPDSVVLALKRDNDNSVRMAAMQRPRVLDGSLLNPFDR